MRIPKFNIIKKIEKLKRKEKIILIVVSLLVVAVLVYIFSSKNYAIKMETSIDNENIEETEDTENDYGYNVINGLSCENYDKRAMAVVLASDSAARPLAGISEADLVFEMPVITGDITRMIAVFICNEPKEIGPMRSARHDFIPLTLGIDAVLAHWGGSHFALDLLKTGIMDNIDALTNPYSTFYRKEWVSPPHNGFTTYDRLLNTSEKLGYRLENSFEGYSFIEDESKIEEARKLKIRYSYPFNVEYHYNPLTNLYARWRAGWKELDRNNNEQVQAKNVIVLEVFSKQIEGQYNDLELEGEGKCQLYQNGEVIDCLWQKDGNKASSKLYFVTEDGEELSFVPGQIWVEIVEPNQEIVWE